jgi:hypothetical protein
MRRTPLAFVLPLLAAAVLSTSCGSSPASPSPSASAVSAGGGGGVGGAGVATLRGRTVDALTGAPLAALTIALDEGVSATTDGDGAFELSAAENGMCAVTISGPGAVPRQTQVRMPGAEVALSLIPARFDVAAFDEMFRSTGALRRWTTAPSLVIVDAVLQFSDLGAAKFTALDERLTAEDRGSLAADLQWGLPRATGGAFTAFASVSVESPAAGSAVEFFAREGRVVVARFRGLSQTGYQGYGRAASRADQVVAGAIMLDRDHDTSGRSCIRSVRVHELGHALGYLHVSRRQSFMNSTGVWEPNDFDADATRIAFQRAPGNVSPDRDPAQAHASQRSALTWGQILP